MHRSHPRRPPCSLSALAARVHCPRLPSVASAVGAPRLPAPRLVDTHPAGCAKDGAQAAGRCHRRRGGHAAGRPYRQPARRGGRNGQPRGGEEWSGRGEPWPASRGRRRRVPHLEAARGVACSGGTSARNEPAGGDQGLEARRHQGQVRDRVPASVPGVGASIDTAADEATVSLERPERTLIPRTGLLARVNGTLHSCG